MSKNKKASIREIKSSLENANPPKLITNIRILSQDKFGKLPSFLDEVAPISKETNAKKLTTRKK